MQGKRRYKTKILNLIQILILLLLVGCRTNMDGPFEDMSEAIDIHEASDMDAQDVAPSPDMWSASDMKKTISPREPACIRFSGENVGQTNDGLFILQARQTTGEQPYPIRITNCEETRTLKLKHLEFQMANTTQRPFYSAEVKDDIVLPQELGPGEHIDLTLIIDAWEFTGSDDKDLSLRLSFEYAPSIELYVSIFVYDLCTISSPMLYLEGSNQRPERMLDGVPTGARIVLDGSNSHSPDTGNMGTYEWTLVEHPMTSHAAISHDMPSSPMAYITPDVSGYYEVSLEFTDLTGRVTCEVRHVEFTVE